MLPQKRNMYKIAAVNRSVAGGGRKACVGLWVYGLVDVGVCGCLIVIRSCRRSPGTRAGPFSLEPERGMA